MPPRISLALVLHNHQPVGNFGWVISEVFEQAYAPMLDALERHPTVSVSLHYSGPLLEWLIAERPTTLERLRDLVSAGQVELLGGGLFEPILVSLPVRDRIGQLTRMADEMEGRFGRRPRGAWLAERVWEPDLPAALVAAGYDWTIVDDAHLRAATIAEDAMWGPYATEDQGALLRVFATEQGLRYRIPFREVDEVLGYLRDRATDDGSRIGTMGDDGEKFGAWPTTWEHCWGTGRWVERFFTALEANAEWLTTTTPSAWLADHQPIGRAYLPTGSYVEMGEWALPAREARGFAEALERARADDRPEARWLRGASWRNFGTRYREVNDLHKQMLRVSDAVAAMSKVPERDRAIDHLYRGQSNDVYWHGLFGGTYISHMRMAAHEHLIAAEDLADTAADALEAAELRDLDLDGIDEVRLADTGQVVTVDLAEGAGIADWDIRSVRHALTAVMRRRPEAYHDRLRETGTGGGDDGAAGGGSTRSIHDSVRATEPGLADRLVYDTDERRSGLVRALSLEVAPTDWAAARPAAGDLAGGPAAPFDLVELRAGRLVVRRDGEIAGASVAITKTIMLAGGRREPTLDLEVGVEHVAGDPIDLRLGIEWSINLLGGGGNPAAWWDIGGTRTGHDIAGEATDVTTISQGNDQVGIAVTTKADPPADAWRAPIETISNSEAGFERVYQGAGLLLSWPVHLSAGERWTGRVRHLVTTDRDRAHDER